MADRRLNRYWPPVDVYSLRACPPVFLRLVGKRDCCLSDVRRGHIGRALSGLAVVAAADRQSGSTQDWKRNGSCQRARVLSQRSIVPAVAQASVASACCPAALAGRAGPEYRARQGRSVHRPRLRTAAGESQTRALNLPSQRRPLSPAVLSDVRPEAGFSTPARCCRCCPAKLVAAVGLSWRPAAPAFSSRTS